MKTDKLMELRQKVIDAGYGEELSWQEALKPCDNADDFFREFMWVVISSGIKNQVARKIEERIYKAWDEGYSTASAFNHKGKVEAIEYVYDNRYRLFSEYLESTEPVDYLATLPWIGEITKWHLAKNLGVDTAKPDRHLLRVSSEYNITPFELCRKLSNETGFRIGTIDLIIWRAANLGFV